MKVEHWDQARWGELNEKNMRMKLESEGFHVSRYAYPRGTFFPDHSHSIDKKDSVLSGRFKITVEGQEFVLEAGDTIEVPAGVVHSAEVMGNQTVVSLDATRFSKA